MSRENRTRYALLGALLHGEKSGYDLKKEFEHRMSHFWAESLGQIYPTLHRLRSEKLVARRSDRSGGSRARTLYRLTTAGRRALSDWLAESPAPESARNELLLKLFFGPELGASGAIEHLEGYQDRLIDQRRLFDAMAGEIDAQAVSAEQRAYWHLTLLSGQEVTDARLRWCRKALRTLRHLGASTGRGGRRAER